LWSISTPAFAGAGSGEVLRPGEPRRADGPCGPPGEG
jgi:hypothetical protein